MLSRVADSLYWMSRYFERADNIARVIDATHSLMLSRVEVATDQRWFRALNAVGLQIEAGNPDPQEAIRRLAADVRHRSSMISCLAAARENASQVREEISSEMWEQLESPLSRGRRPERDRRRRRVGDAAGDRGARRVVCVPRRQRDAR